MREGFRGVAIIELASHARGNGFDSLTRVRNHFPAVMKFFSRFLTLCPVLCLNWLWTCTKLAMAVGPNSYTKLNSRSASRPNLSIDVTCAVMDMKLIIN
jgi:hypothetical protein